MTPGDLCQIIKFGEFLFHGIYLGPVSWYKKNDKLNYKYLFLSTNYQLHELDITNKLVYKCNVIVNYINI